MRRGMVIDKKISLALREISKGRRIMTSGIAKSIPWTMLSSFSEINKMQKL